MSALPRPDLPPGPHLELVTHLHELHHRDGWRSLRTLARETGVSHTTISKVFSSRTLPSWGTLALLVEAMGGDHDHFHELWLDASAPVAASDGELAGGRIAGRRAELGVVRRHLEAGSGLLLVTGEAGMGKTTVLEAAANSARATVLIAAGRCLPLSAEVPLLPLTEALRQVGRTDGGRAMANALQACPDYVGDALSAVLPEWSTGVDLPDADDRWMRHRLFSGVAELCGALSEKGPFAMVLEDLHWADELTLDLVEHLVQHAEVRMLGSWRTDDPDVPEVRQRWFSRARRSVVMLPLVPLTAEETSTQIEMLKPGTSAEEAARIHARSCGQPLFTEQLVHADAGDPTYLVDLLDDRVRRLTGSHWRVVSVLALADRPLTESDVSLAGGVEEERLSSVLHELQDRRLLGGTGSRIALVHPLLGEAVRRRLLPQETAATHRRVAAVLASAPDAEPAEVARHWQGANEPAEELRWLVKAARSAADRYAAAQAADHWRRVLALWPSDKAEVGHPPVRRHEVVAGIATQLDLAGRPRDAVPVLDVELALPDPPHLYEVAERADLLRQLARFNSSQFVSGDLGLRLVEQAIELYRTLPPTPGLAAALTWRGTELEWHGRRDEATAVLGEAAELAAQTGDRLLERSVRAQWAWQLAASGDTDGVDEMAQIIHEFGHDGSLPRNLAVAVRHTDILLMSCRPPGEVAQAAEPALAQAARWQITTNHAQVLKANVAQAWRRAGNVREAMHMVRPDTEHEQPAAFPLLHIERVLLEVLLGHDDAARRRIDCLRLGLHEVVDPYLLEAHLHHRLWMDDPADGLELAKAVLVSRHDEVSPGTAGDLLVLVARAAADSTATSSLPTRSAARRCLDDLCSGLHYDPFSPTAVLADRAALPQWEAETQRLFGHDTIEMWLKAARTWRGLTRPHDAAYCHWRAAQIALRDRQGTVAARLLGRAGREARQHVPLTRAIARTATGGR